MGGFMAESNLYQSIVDLVTSVDKNNITLPEFQRDFVWEQEKTYELFDSLIRDIFIGAIIYGKPSFDISVREIDKRPRKGKGSRTKLEVTHISQTEIQQRNQGDSFRLVLDGQQRITSLYRALQGIDECWFIINNDDDCIDEISSIPFKDRSLEKMLYKIGESEDVDRLSVKISDAYNLMNTDYTEEEIKQEHFGVLEYINKMDDDEKDREFRRYIKVVKLLQNLFNKDLLLPYYLLNMDTQKFALFFERSNTKGIQLNFIDILAAKLYKGFNLRDKIEEANNNFSTRGYKFGKEVAVRTIAYIVSEGKEVDKKYILDNLTYEHFNQHWHEVYTYYEHAIDFLNENNFIISYKWMPYENMLIPIMIFLKELGGKDFSQMNENQLEFFKYWYWAAIFSKRYTSSSNESIVKDCNILTKIARGNKIIDKTYFNKLRSVISNPEDLLAYNKNGNSIYKGILNFINYNASGLSDWKNTKKLTMLDLLEDHHIFPVEFLKSSYKSDDKILSLVDCVLNRTLIPKITNIKIGKKKPSVYLSELKNSNNMLEECIENHLIPKNILTGEYDKFYTAFLEERGKIIFNLINEQVIEREEWIVKEFYKIKTINSTGNIKIFGRYYKKVVNAVYDMETEKVLLEGKVYSVSKAADKAKCTISGNSKTSTNGWTFWRYIDEDNVERKLNSLK